VLGHPFPHDDGGVVGAPAVLVLGDHAVEPAQRLRARRSGVACRIMKSLSRSVPTVAGLVTGFACDQTDDLRSW
jgi:hypothetical protein